ncbi:FAD/NAD(P)-binding domain-containing protein [Hypoxylon sp. FL0543]|nr:FAD/NAD(P)-binding domain-containing protein [Hypoxylon sp. FL0543]
MPLNVLIIGAGVAGPAFAMLLQNSNPEHKITVIERSPSLRTAGQQIDVKMQGVEILKRMGLFEAIKSQCVNEKGLEMLDSDGKQVATFGVNPSDEKRITLTAEYEIMRGDVVRVLYDASLKQNARFKELGKGGDLAYEFDKSITKLEQTEDGVDVTFSDGQKKRYDLVVGADGQGSRTRRLAFGEDSDAAFKSLGVHAAYYSIPRTEDEGELARAYSAPGRRLIMTRTSGRPVTQVLLFSMGNGERLRKIYKEPIEKQKEAFEETFRDAGWQAERLLKGLKTCDDFYAHEVGQIWMKQGWSKGRVALLGDAGYAPSPFTGMGMTSCLIGAYVLAGELARHGNDVNSGLKAYEEVARPPIEKECQKLPIESLGVFYPSSKLGVWALRKAAWVVSKVEPLTYRPRSKDNQWWKVPEYPELNLKS